jgi:HSP20 family protein
MKLVRFQTPVPSSWSTLSRLSNLRNEIDRLFEAPWGELGRNAFAFGGWAPAVDLYEDNDNVVVKVELAGMKKEDIELTLHEGALNISGERKTEKKFEDAGVYRSERSFGRFQRTVPLPTPVDGAKVKADYKDGVLTVTHPKTETAKPKQINVSVT